MKGIISILMVIYVVRCTSVRIRGGGSSLTVVYDPSNPVDYSLSCVDNRNRQIDNARWTWNGQPINSNGGRVLLNRNSIGTTNPQQHEGLYRCRRGTEVSDPLAFFGKTHDIF